jgi:hypothetical protein
MSEDAPRLLKDGIDGPVAKNGAVMFGGRDGVGTGGDIREGTIDPVLGKLVEHLIIASHGAVVYLDEDLYTEWYLLVGECPSDPASGAVFTRVSRLESVPIDHLRPANRLAFRRMIGESVARLLADRNPAAAASALDMAEEFVKARNEETSRLWYLAATVVFAAMVGCIGLVLWACRGSLVTVFGPVGLRVVLGACAGAAGAFVSVSFRLGRLGLDPAAGWPLHALEAFTRVAGGMAGALLVALCLHAKVLLALPSGAADTGAPSSQAMALALALCMIAGASERLVPNLIEQTRVGVPGGGKQDEPKKPA